MKFLLDFPLDKTPPEISKDIHRIIREMTESDDPYREVKRRSNEIAKGIYPDLKKIISKSANNIARNPVCYHC